MQKERFLNHDEETKVLSSRKELTEYNDFRKAHDEWIIAPINEIAAWGISNLPLFIPDRAENINVKIHGFKAPVEKIDTDDIDNQECINTTGLFLIVPYQNKNVALPTDERSLASIYQRCDDFCGIMTRTEPKAKKRVLPVEEKAERLTRDNSLFDADCKILYRDGKIRFDASEQYTIADNAVLIDALETELAANHPNYQFSEAAVNHDYLVVRYTLNDMMMDEGLRLKLNDTGSDIHQLQSGVQFTTSDTGCSAVKANVFLTVDGVTLYLKGVSINHKDEDLLDSFKKEIKRFAEILKESEERIEELGNMDINDVAGTVKKITSFYSTVFPQKVSQEVIDEMTIRYPSGGTAVDVYLALADIVDRHVKSNELSLTRQLDMTEQVAGLIYLQFDKIDSGEIELKK